MSQVTSSQRQSVEKCIQYIYTVYKRFGVRKKWPCPMSVAPRLHYKQNTTVLLTGQCLCSIVGNVGTRFQQGRRTWIRKTVSVQKCFESAMLKNTSRNSTVMQFMHLYQKYWGFVLRLCAFSCVCCVLTRWRTVLHKCCICKASPQYATSCVLSGLFYAQTTCHTQCTYMAFHPCAFWCAFSKSYR